MAATAPPDNEALRRFLRRVWQHDIAPLLRDDRSDQRKKSARVGGKVAATAGLVFDTVFRLKGRPFTRSFTVLGATAGAILPDAWDWRWLRESAGREQRRVVEDQVRRRARELELDEASALFGLRPTAARDDLKTAWRAASKRWHPDRAPDENARAEYHVRFVAYQAAYERLVSAYENGDLPRARQ